MNLNNTQSNNNDTKVKIASGDTWYFLRQFGQGILNNPHGVDVDPANGHVYIADTGNNRIAVFLPDGSLGTTFGSFGAAGPEDLTIGPTAGGGNAIYVTDPANNKIDAFTLTGTLLASNAVTYAPHGIGFGGAGGVFGVPDPVTKRVYQYTPMLPDGTLRPFGNGSFTYVGFDMPTDVACCLNPPPNGDLLYVTDPGPLAGNGIFAFDANPPNQHRLGCCGGGPAIYGIDSSSEENLIH